MKNSKVIIISLAGALSVLVLALLGYYFFPSRQGEDVLVNNIIKGRKITFQDMKTYFRNNQFDSGKEDPNKYFSQSIINQDTVKYFKFLQREIKGENLEDHLKKVKDYLHSVIASGKADEMFALYQKFCAYEADLAKKMQKWPQPKDAADMVRYLESVQEYRREFFGAEVADTMWGIEVKGHEFNIRKGAIIHDPDLYGDEKERRISALKAEMWGTGTDSMEGPPQGDSERYASYQEKEAIYKRDLDELSEDKRREKIAEFRNEVFTQDQVARLEKVDEEVEQEKTKEDVYYAQENRIKSDQNMSKDEQEKAIRDLQNQTFGDEAESFRRRQNIEKDLETHQYRK
jgi:lipase chaperone LimK